MLTTFLLMNRTLNLGHLVSKFPKETSEPMGAHEVEDILSDLTPPTGVVNQKG